MTEEKKIIQDLLERVEKLERQVAKWKEFENELGEVLEEFELKKIVEERKNSPVIKVDIDELD